MLRSVGENTGVCMHERKLLVYIALLLQWKNQIELRSVFLENNLSVLWLEHMTCLAHIFSVSCET